MDSAILMKRISYRLNVVGKKKGIIRIEEGKIIRTKGQTTIYKTYTIKDRVTRFPQKKPGLNWGASEGYTVPAPLVAPKVETLDWDRIEYG